MRIRSVDVRASIAPILICLAAAVSGCGGSKQGPLAPAPQATGAVTGESSANLDVPIPLPLPGEAPAGNVPPEVMILFPQPSPFFAARLEEGSSVVVRGWDPDGGDDHQLAEYRWIVLGESTPVTASLAMAFPDSVARYYAPRDWEGWQSMPGIGTEIVLPAVPHFVDHVLVVVAIDRAGDHSRVFSLSRTMLHFKVVPAPSLPREGASRLGR
jgi:hypothetical protein